MKNIILTLLLIFSTYTSAEKQTMTAAEQSQEAYKKWANELNDFLIDHADADISVMGYYHKHRMLSIQSKDNNQIEREDMARAVNDLVTNEKLHPQSLMFAYDVCSRLSIEELCDTQLIISKLIHKAPKNLMVYIYDLNQAVQENNQAEIKAVIENMAKSSSSRSYFYLSKKLDGIINQYGKTHPLEEDNFAQEIKSIKGFSDERIKHMVDNPDKYQLLTTKMSYKLALAIPAFRALTEVCKEYTDLYVPCLKIAETMINKSDTLIGIMIGHVIKTEVFKLDEMDLQAEIAKISQELFKKEYLCIGKALNASQHSLDNLFDLEFLEIGAKIERNEGEYASIKKLAELNYQKQLELGYEYALDPELCFEQES